MSKQNEKNQRKKIPNPGSKDAINMGCTCAVLDNGHGAGCGQFTDSGEPCFWITENCPIHGIESSKGENENK